ncbi:MAG: hypothetical protein ACLTYN_17910 [Dysosmobacter welbionis]
MATASGQQKKMGVSCDWSRSRFTMDEAAPRLCGRPSVSCMTRPDLQGKPHHQLVPPHHRPVRRRVSMWTSPATRIYPLSPADGSGDLVVATTRPETMMGDTAWL